MTTMKLTQRTVLEFGISQTAEVLNHGYSDYFVSIQLDLSQFHTMLRTNQIDVCLSKVVLQGGKPVGVGLISRRGWTSRLAGMAVIPEARGKKIGQWLLAHLIEEAKARGDRFMELEVIQTNEPAFRLYQKMGFKSIRKLASYSQESPSGTAAGFEEIDMRSLANLVNSNSYPNLPWQISGENLAVSAPPAKAYRLESAFAAITNPEAERISFLSILTLPHARNRGQAGRLMKALFARFPGKIWAIPGYYPEEMNGFLLKMGFKLETLNQYHMILNLI
jgi:ribosomal protein S18 acetylase RimI-like enzyme